MLYIAARQSLSFVVVPHGVFVGTRAFFGTAGGYYQLMWPSYPCAATVVISVGETSIPASGFRGCSVLRNISIPQSVTSIGERAFEGCSSLTAITIPVGVTSLPDKLFKDCSSLENITFEGGNVSSFGQEVFQRTALTAFTMPDGVASVGRALL